VVCGVAAAIAAALHYGAAAMRQARDLPNLPTAMIGGAVAGTLSSVLALIAWQLIGSKPFHPFLIGILLSGLGGEYLGGRCDDVIGAVRAGCLSVAILLPLDAGLMIAVS
jgi:hypothetical protein